MLEGRNILVIDDEENMRELLADLLHDNGAEVSLAGDLRSGRDLLSQQIPDVTLLDLKLPDGSGLDLLKEIIAQPDPPAVIMISAFGTIETAVKAVQAGAFDFIVKPFNIEDILRVIRSALGTDQAVAATAASSPQLGSDGIVGQSREIQDVLECIDKVAESDAPVLILGESGTGKELIARAVHLRSTRRSAPLMPINCAAIPEPLLESELFGYEKGAFSGAAARHAGKIQAAQGGTVFLDEIGDMSPALQSKLLRALEEKQVYPVGSNDPVQADVRFVAATHRDLDEAVRNGDFREDLYFRLNVLTLELPPLRERGKDIPMLVEHFTRMFTQKYRRPDFQVPSDVVEEMLRYSWPGNIRELRNIIEKLILLGDSAFSQLPWRCMVDTNAEAESGAAGASVELVAHESEKPRPDSSSSLDGMLENLLSDGNDLSLAAVVKAVERETIVRTLNACEGNRRETARRLCISYKTLFNKFHEHGIQIKARAN